MSGIDSKKKYVRPPEKFSKQQIQAWVREEAAVTKPGLPVKIVDTEEWADYVNHHHFVPMTVEGVPAGFEFDYNWIETENPKHRLPSAEVTETGEFLFWADRCNYYEMTEEKCRHFIQTAVRHEARHFDQWQKVAVNVLAILGYVISPKKLPSTLAELNIYTGAREAFMRIWSDPAHYQCREVEVYTAQIENGDISKDKTSESEFKRRLQGLYVYAHGDENSPGCANSIWALEFSTFLEKADAIFKANHFQPPKSDK